MQDLLTAIPEDWWEKQVMKARHRHQRDLERQEHLWDHDPREASPPRAAQTQPPPRGPGDTGPPPSPARTAGHSAPTQPGTPPQPTLPPLIPI